LAAEVRHALVAFVAKSGRLPDDLAFLFFSRTMAAGSEPVFDTFKTTASESGTAMHEGRKLPAAVVVVEMDLVNRSEGKYGRLCFVHAAIYDKEFGMWRGIRSIACDSEDAAEKLAEWRRLSSFESQKGKVQLGKASAPQAPSASQAGPAAAIPMAVSVPTPASEPARQATCLHWEPAAVTVNGILRRKTFPGLPNFEDVAKGDEAEVGLYLELPVPLCVAGDPDADPGYGPTEDVRLLQLIGPPESISALAPRVNGQLTVAGSLSPGITGHHHAVLLTVK
jgi:hypothetical protein